MPDRKCKNISSIKVDTDLSCCDLCSLRVGNKQQPELRVKRVQTQERGPLSAPAEIFQINIDLKNVIF